MRAVSRQLDVAPAAVASDDVGAGGAGNIRIAAVITTVSMLPSG